MMSVGVRALNTTSSPVRAFYFEDDFVSFILDSYLTSLFRLGSGDGSVKLYDARQLNGNHPVCVYMEHLMEVSTSSLTIFRV